MSGGLAITLDRAGDRVQAELALTPGPAPARLLAGRGAAEAAALVPLVFNLCAVAQGRAARAALGLAGHDAGEETALRQEHLRDHLHCFAVAWPALLGQGPDNDLLAAAGALARGEGAALRERLTGRAADLGDLDGPGLDRVLAAGETPLLRLLAALRRRLQPSWGRASLPAPTPSDVAGRLAGGQAPLCETTALDHVAGRPLVAALAAAEGRSLFLRMIGRVLDCLRVLDPRALIAPALAPAPGVGIAAAVRGVLGHRAELRDGRVADYRLLAPTDWNLAPGGILARVLNALPAGEDLPFLARLAISCINPCVPTVLAIDGRRYGPHA
ncbi:nickel-dependent hydrogenase large subunit [Zavarzinia compransoris]|uniref:Hydrogenase n=1 Tax=Zavarzinia compransoris TaxID=1264899 RepID=A0A317E9A0_9PROT|nr:nickel-dependent hydrogenase large subunit [Zavarzinia compransoris]PWR23152.1 hypothetical protein DKG75_00855 [Zavarzinia compransoris]TDP46291.1 nickel-dependent hydrogenase [Zavarzinia compransoris]